MPSGTIYASSTGSACNVPTPPRMAIGVLIFLFGIASMFYPPLKAIIGSITTSAAITVGGLALIVLPTVIVGNELLIMGGVAAAVGLWFLAHRHGQLRGQVDAGAGAASNSETKGNV